MKHLYTLAIFCCFIFNIISAQAQSFMLRGDTLVGEMGNDGSGHAVSFNAEGNIMAIGAPSNGGATGAVQDAGNVQIFRWNDSAWVQMGQDIDASTAGGWFGNDVQLNDSGNVVVIGSRYNDVVDTDRGLVRVFKWNGTDWMPRGGNLFGPTIYSEAGTSVSINGHGDVIAFGAPRAIDQATSTLVGQTLVFEWNDTIWKPKGISFSGSNNHDKLGNAVDLNQSGNTIAFLVPGAATTIGSGVVYIYDWNGTSWGLKGSRIEPTSASGSIDMKISLADDGQTVAISDPDFGSGTNATGRVQIFDFSNGNWQQRGNDLVGDFPQDQFGYSVDLSADGNSFVTGAIAHGRTLSDTNITGYARVFRWSGSAWDSVGTVYGQLGLYDFGSAVAINTFGNTIAVGERETYSTPSPIAGNVYTFALACNIVASVTDSMPVFMADYVGGNYQWYRCDSTGFTLLPGDTNQRFTATVNASYAVIVRDSNCVDTSACFTVNNIGLPEMSAAVFDLYPNPTNQSCTVYLPENVENATLILFDAMGKLLHQIELNGEEKYTLTLPANAGVYWVQLRTPNGQHTVKVLKLE